MVEMRGHMIEHTYKVLALNRANDSVILLGFTQDKLTSQQFYKARGWREEDIIFHKIIRRRYAKEEKENFWARLVRIILARARYFIQSKRRYLLKKFFSIFALLALLLVPSFADLPANIVEVVPCVVTIPSYFRMTIDQPQITWQSLPESDDLWYDADQTLYVGLEWAIDALEPGITVELAIQADGDWKLIGDETVEFNLFGSLKFTTSGHFDVWEQETLSIANPKVLWSGANHSKSISGQILMAYENSYHVTGAGDFQAGLVLTASVI